MKELYGKITASLLEKGPDRTEELIEMINRNIDPPEKITPESVHIRAMFIVSDRVNSCGGCFPVDEHENLAELLIDSPVLVGHRKDSLPIARNFHAEKVTKGEEHWIKVYFYWLRDADGAEDLRRNIDGGIYKEGSISFVFAFPECSVCGEDIRACGHRPFKEYRRNGNRTTAYFKYRKIIKVLETSLVYRGAVHDTSITGDLLFAPLSKEGHEGLPETALKEVIRIDDPGMLSDKCYAVFPAYESLRVVVQNDQGEIRILTAGEELKKKIAEEIGGSLPDTGRDWIIEGRLVAFRGKQRLPVEKLLEYLEGRDKAISRIEFKAVDLISLEDKSLEIDDYSNRFAKLKELFSEQNLSIVPVRFVDRDSLKKTVEKISTRNGVEIISLNDNRRYHCLPSKKLVMQISECQPKGDGYEYHLEADSDKADTTITGAIYSSREFNVGEYLELQYDNIESDNEKTILNGLRLSDYLGTHHPGEKIYLTETETLSSDNIRIFKDDKLWYCRISHGKSNRLFRIMHFDFDLFQLGRRFLADEQSGDRAALGDKIVVEEIADIKKHDECLDVNLSSGSTVRFRPAIIGRQNHWLLYFKTGSGDNRVD